MSEPKDHNDLEQGIPGIPSSGQIGADVEDEVLQCLLQNHGDEQNSQFRAEVDFHNDSGFVPNPLERGSAEQNIRETAIPSELQPGAEVPVSTNQTENGSEEPGAEVPVSMKQTDSGSEKPGDAVPVSMNLTENYSEKTGDEVPACINQAENDSEKAGNHVPAFKNQTENDSERAGNQVPAFVNQTENDSEKTGDQVPAFVNQTQSDSEQNGALDVKTKMESEMMNTHMENGSNSLESDVKAAHLEDNQIIETPLKQERAEGEQPAPIEGPKQSFTFDHYIDGDDSGTEEEQAAFIKELENFFRERGMEFKPPKFYGEGLNCLKLWRAVTKLGGYDRV
ncbi:putative AT-rich interactive domain-containing protein 5 [Cocos nucifera]|nr:putative AT-rich interactive domain-containing protein 5 [Cocos nucifera]